MIIGSLVSPYVSFWDLKTCMVKEEIVFLAIDLRAVKSNNSKHIFPSNDQLRYYFKRKGVQRFIVHDCTS